MDIDDIVDHELTFIYIYLFVIMYIVVADFSICRVIISPSLNSSLMFGFLRYSHLVDTRHRTDGSRGDRRHCQWTRSACFGYTFF